MNIYTPTVAYLYKWTDTQTNRWYIGSRTKQGCHPNDGYICSSRVVKPLVLEQRSRWTRTILCLGTPEYILDLETRLLAAVDAKNDPLSYNQHNGDGKFTTAGVEPWNKGGGKPTNKPAWNRGLTKDTDASVAKISNSLQGRVPPNKGKKMSYEQWLKVVEQHRNRSEETCRKISIANTGKKQTAESNAKRSQTQKGQPSKRKGRTFGPRSKNKNPSPLIGLPKPKVVCRLTDRKEMTASNFVQWLNSQDKRA